MKRVLTLIVMLSAGLSLWLRADGPDDQYVRIYRLIQEADQLQSAGQRDLAREKFAQAQSELKSFQASYPSWNERVIRFRLSYVEEQLGSLPGKPAEPSKPGVTTAPPGGAPASSDRETLIVQLRDEVRRLGEENAILHAKLKEALTAQPAVIDSSELRKAEERVRILEKEVEVLRIALAQAKQNQSAPGGAEEELKKALNEANRKLAEQTDLAVTLSREKEILEARLQVTREENEELKGVRASRDPEKTPLPGLKLPPDERDKAQTELELASANESIRKQVREITRLQSELTRLEQDNARLEAARKELQAKLANLPSASVEPSTSETARLRQVENERDELLKKLNETSRQIYDNKARGEQLQQQEADSQAAALRARLEVYEARTVPYTPEELALFKPPPLAASKSDPKSGRKPIRELPRGAGPLLAEAERAFAMGRFDQAEQKYLEVLRMDEKNVFTLANLAACQLEQNRLGEAEASVHRALALESTDGYSLSLLGILSFRQEKYNEALNALSRSAQLDPENPETQNYLGVTLSQLGQRGSAETALRRAIQLSPGYGGAHYNLAVVYATQNPPFTELAQWHYQKALATGHSQNPELEKIIESARASN